MNEMVRLAGDLAVDAGDARPRPKRAAELLHRDLEAERVAGRDDALEAALVDAGEQPDPVAEARLLGDVDGHRLGQRLDLEHAGHDRQAREVALEEPLGRGHGLDARRSAWRPGRTRRSGRRAGTASDAGSAPRSRAVVWTIAPSRRGRRPWRRSARSVSAATVSARSVGRSARRARVRAGSRGTSRRGRRPPGTRRCRRGRAGSS